MQNDVRQVWCVGTERMKRGKSTGKPTKAEQERMNKLKRMRCICCRMNDEGAWAYLSTGLTVEIHHLVDMGTRALSGGHMATLNLCSWHHDGRGFNGPQHNLSNIYGPWLKQRERFRTVYGTERELLAKVNEMLYGQS